MVVQKVFAENKSASPRPKQKTKKVRWFRKWIIFGLLLILSLNFLNHENFPNKPIINSAKAAGPISLELAPIQDIFISPSTINGNRRMLFVGTYTDETVCGLEGCPPVYSDSYSLINFDWNALPANAIVTSAKLKLFHYGSNAPFVLKISKVDGAWTENTNSTNSPGISGSFGTFNIPEFNTSNPNQIQATEITFDPSLVDVVSNRQNGIAISANTNIGDPGVVFCSKDFDTFCLQQFSPKLILEYIPNNFPEKPVLGSLESFYGGNCDASNYAETENCMIAKDFNFTSSNLIDNDPSSGAFAYSKFLLSDKNTNNLILQSQEILSNPNSSWVINLENGNYTLQVDSYDKKGLKTSSNIQNFLYDTIPPEIPILDDLAQITYPSSNQVSIKIKSNPVKDNLDNQIFYQVQYSTDSAFLNFVNSSDWNSVPEINLTNNEKIEPGKNYFFRMRAKDSKENISDWSNTTSTNIDSLPKTPEVNFSNFKINRFKTTSFITNQKIINLNGFAQKNHKVEIYINNQKSLETLANQNCFAKNTIEFCNFSINYQHNLPSLQDVNGQPLKSFSIQFRAIDENQNTSILTQRKIIYFDNIAPIKPNLTLSSDKNILDIDGITMTNGNKLTANISGEKYSDLEYKLFDPKNKLIESKLLRINANNQTQTSSNLKLDGKYRLELTSIDSAGNRSEKVIKEFGRDTVGPGIDEANINVCDEKICLNLKSEIGSLIYSNNISQGILTSNPQKIEIVKYWAYGKVYKFNIQLKDKLGNTSLIKTLNLETDPLDIGGRGAAGENKILDKDSDEYKQIKKLKRDFQKPEILIDYYVNENKFNVVNTNIPVPTLESSLTLYDKNIEILGNSIYKNQGMKVKVKKIYYSYNEASNKCGVDTNCLSDKLGENVFEYLKNLSISCSTKSYFILFLTQYCSYNSLSEIRKTDYEEISNTVDEMKVTLIKKTPETRLKNEDRNDSEDSRFTTYLGLEKDVASGDEIYAKMIVRGHINYDNKYFDYGEHWSGPSNELIIDPKSDFKKLENGITAKVLDVPYFNQWLNREGDSKKNEPLGGWMMCGAASSVMVAGYFDKVKYDKNNPYTSLKKYMSTDNGENLNASCTGNDPYANPSQNFTSTGAFAITSKGTQCDANSQSGMKQYLERYQLSTEKYTLTNDGTIQKNEMDTIKSALDNGNPIIMSYSWSQLDFSHIAVIRGYSYDKNNNIRGLIFNDPYRDVSKSPPTKNIGTYSLDGEEAYYPITYDQKNKNWIAVKGMLPKYMIVIKK